MENETIKAGIMKGYIRFNQDNKKITYTHCNKTYNFQDPEEKVRAEYYVELIEKYQYEPKKINLEIVVPRRTPNDLADIVVYEDDEQLNPYIIVECKKDGTTDNEFSQAVEQAFGNANSIRAPFTSVVAGNTRRFFDVKNFAPNERERNIIADIPIRYGKVQEFKYKKGDRDWDIKPINKQDLIRLLEKCNNTLWDGGKMSPTESFDELSKIIFVKIRDEQKARRNGEAYDFQIKTHETPDSVYERVTAIYNESKKLDPEVFTDSIVSQPIKLFAVVNHLQGVNLSKTDLDTKGVAFERFMEDFFKGKQGQYFTPREVVNFIINVCGLKKTDRVLDPACGSGGFLLYALDKIREEAKEYYEENTGEYYKYWHDFAAENLYGIEVNEKIARVAKMNMIIHDDGHTNVIGCDSLENFEKIQSINQKFKKESFDIIITNPPFGASIKKEEKPYLKDFTLGKSSKGKVRDNQKSEILFIERCFQFLKPGTGKMAIVLPDGILTNTTQKYVRDFITDNFQIEAIFSIPQITFIHYGAGVKSSIFLLRRKGLNEEIEDYEVFLSVINNVGYDATGRKTKSDLRDVLDKYNRFIAGEKFKEHNIFTRKLSDLNRNRLDAYYYSPLFDDILKKISKMPHPLKSLSEVCVEDGIFNGKTPAKDDYTENIADSKIIKVASLKKGKVDLNRIEYVNPEINLNKFVENGDILILSSAHQAEYLGKNPCIVNIPEEMKGTQFSFVGELINIRLDKKKVNPYYLLQLLCTRPYFLLINREKRGQTSHLYPSDLETVKIPVPEDISLQNENAKQYIKHYKEYEELTEKAEKLLQKSIDDFEENFLKV